VKKRSGHRGPGISGGYQGVDARLSYELSAHHNARIGFGPAGFNRRLMHIHHLRTVMNTDPEFGRVFMVPDLIRQFLLIAYEDDLEIRITSTRLKSAINVDGRTNVPPHRVQRNFDQVILLRVFSSA
jgi:hypothetical protein